MDEVQDIPDDIKVIERPWCSKCEGNMAYFHTWTSVQRSDLDGRTYNEVIEVRKCKSCGQEMIFVKDLRLLIFGVNVICLVVWLALTLIWIFLINLKSYLIFGIIFNFLLIFILRLFTRRQRQIVSNWKKWHEIEKIKKKNPDI